MSSSATSSTTSSTEGAHGVRPEPKPAVELTFWRTLYRYLLSIVASLGCGFLWSITGARLLNLKVLPTIYTGVIALAVGFLLMALGAVRASLLAGSATRADDWPPARWTIASTLTAS